MLALFGNLAPLEILVILVIAVLVFGKDLPQAASRAYAQIRRLRNAVDDLRRDTGIDRELRNIERSVREAEWEARSSTPARASTPVLPARALPASTAAPEVTPTSAGVPDENPPIPGEPAAEAQPDPRPSG